jgi:hypothetical protein
MYENTDDFKTIDGINIRTRYNQVSPSVQKQNRSYMYESFVSHFPTHQHFFDPSYMSHVFRTV